MASQASQSPSRHLTTIGRGYLPPRSRLIQDQLSPWVRATNNEGEDAWNFTYPVWDESDALLLEDTTMASAPHGAGSRTIPTVDMEFTTNPGELQEHRIKFDVTLARVKQLGGRPRVMARGARLTQFRLRLEREARIAAACLSTATYPSTDYYVQLLTATDKFTDRIKSDPKGVFQDARKQISDMSGQDPNVMVVPHAEAMVLADHPYIQEVIRDDNKGTGSEAFMAGPLEGLPPVIQDLNVIVPRAVYKSSPAGIVEARTDLWNGGIWIGYVNLSPTPVEDEASFMYTFHDGTQIQTFEGVTTDGSEDEYVVSRGYYKDLVVANRMGYLIDQPT